MDRAHRRELKHDKFVEQVGHTVEYASEHKSQVLKYLGIALGLAIAALAAYWYTSHQHSKRQAELTEALRVMDAQIGPPSEFVVSFPTEQDKQKAVEKALTDVANKYSGDREGLIARYFLGVTYADQGKLNDAEKQLKQVAESGKDDYASQAKLSLAQIYDAQGKQGDAEKLLRSVIDDPTILVSKEQATIALARLKARTSPAEARKLLEPLRTERGPVSRAAITMLSELPPQ